MELLRKGKVWVNTEIAVTAGDTPFFRHTDNGGLLVGPDGWRADADTADADAISGTYLIGNAAPGLAYLSINEAHSPKMWIFCNIRRLLDLRVHFRQQFHNLFLVRLHKLYVSLWSN